jgi:hypothetical protein
MKKRTIAVTWLVGLALVLVGGIVAVVATAAWLAHVTSVTADGSAYQADSFFWTTVVVWWSAGIVATAGILTQLVAWVGSVMNTHRFADKTWFNVLLWVGILGIVTSPLFGLGAVIWYAVTIAYMVGGPDSTAPQPSVATPTAPPARLAATS